ALRDRNYPVEYILAPDEGHGFARPVNNLAMLAAAEKFLAKHLGGRYQESMTPEVKKRLSEITVDPKTVKVTDPAAPSGNGAAAEAGFGGNWNLAVDAGGQVVVVSLAIQQKGNAFTATMASEHGGGTIDNGAVNGNSMKGTINATLNGESAVIQVSGKLEEGKMTGTMDVPGFGTLPFAGTRVQ